MTTDADLDIHLRYVGQRFDGARLPLDVLVDLPAFRDLLVAYAKEQWKKQNPDRQRVPKGFERALSFSLTRIDSGSAVPALRWEREEAQASLPEIASELGELVEVAYREVRGLVARAANDEFPRALSAEQVRALNKFGSGLQDDERIEFLAENAADQPELVYLDSAIRKRLIVNLRETYEARYEDIGELVGVHYVDNKRAYVMVRTNEFGDIRLDIEAERLKEFDGNIGASVEFALQIELDNADALRGITVVHRVALEESVSSEYEERLTELLALPEGWDDGAGRSITDAAVGSARSFLAMRPAPTAYKIFPTLGGGLLIDFEANGWDLSLEFDPNGSVEFFGIEIDGGGELLPVTYRGPDERFFAAFDEQVSSK